MGARVTVLLTPAFYTRAEAMAQGGIGQNSANSSAVPAYREVIRRVVATFRSAGSKIAIVDAGKIMGPTLAAYLQWDLTSSRADLNVFDNIHEGRSARTKIAYGMARAAYGLATPKRTKASAITAIPASWYQNSWTSASGTAVFWLDEHGRKHIDGIINTAGATFANGTIVLRLPTFHRPARTIELPAITQKATYEALG